MELLILVIVLLLIIVLSVSLYSVIDDYNFTISKLPFDEIILCMYYICGLLVVVIYLINLLIL